MSDFKLKLQDVNSNHNNLRSTIQLLVQQTEKYLTVVHQVGFSPHSIAHHMTGKLMTSTLTECSRPIVTLRTGRVVSIFNFI